MVLATSSQMLQLTGKYLLKSCYSVEYNYQIYDSIFRIAATNINNVLNYFSNVHELPSMFVIYADWHMVTYL